MTGNLCTRYGAFISAALDAWGCATCRSRLARRVCGWPRSRRRTIQETPSGPKLSAKGGSSSPQLAAYTVS